MYLYFAAAIIATCVYIWIVSAPPAPPAPPIETIDTPNYNRAREDVDTMIAQGITRIHPSMQEMCDYATSDGRRVRGVIVAAIAPEAAPCVIAVEYIHAASLVIDDIMDGDTTRRGKATVATKWGNAAAQMVSVQLTSAAFIELHDGIDHTDAAAARRGMAILRVLADTLKNLSIGQWQEEQRSDAADAIMRQKTGSLFEMAFLSGWIARGGSEESIPRVRELAIQFGDLFQIVDDLGDATRDLCRGVKTNYALLHGRERAQSRCVELAEVVLAECRELEIDTAAIEEIVLFLIEKSKK